MIRFVSLSVGNTNGRESEMQSLRRHYTLTYQHVLVNKKEDEMKNEKWSRSGQSEHDKKEEKEGLRAAGFWPVDKNWAVHRRVMATCAT